MGALIFWRAGTPRILRPIWLAEKLPPEEKLPPQKPNEKL